MRAADRVSVAALVALLLAGVWLVVGPFVVGVQRAGGHWSGAQRLEGWLGAALAVLALVGLVVYVAAGLAELGARQRGRFGAGQLSGRRAVSGSRKR